ncbi:carboxypeptidase regulatory-like domain-containing protein [Dyella sp. 20L07]|uniref:TonB-dependent receptor n=1 Tax=Dyella sp. 20L07 TaxID=3384240 RepID=UPI003D2C9DE3
MYAAGVGSKSRCIRKTVLALGLALALGGVAHAQSITGGLYGKEPTGKGVTVEVSSPATGYRKQIQPDDDGRYSLGGLNPGTYVVTVSADGQAVGTRTVNVTANVQSPVQAVQAATSGAAGASPSPKATNLSGVVVSATSHDTNVIPIDVKTPELSSNYSMNLVNELPTGRGMESVALLKSNVRYDDQTTGLVQMGGASPVENRYYFNEFDTTYDYNGLGATTLPAEAVSSVQVMNSNGSVSWTNATGGIMSSTVRQGTNDFQAGYSLYFTPATSRLLNPRQHNSYTSDGDYYHYSSDNTHSANITAQYLWASGALVKDKLFFFAMLGNSPDNTSVINTQNFQNQRAYRDKNALLNMTWNITNNQSLNVVGERDWGDTFINQYTLQSDYNPHSVGRYFGWSEANVKNQFLIGNYHWQINDDMSLRLMGGYLSQSSLSPTSDSGTGLPYVSEVDPVTNVSRNIGVTSTANQLFPFQYYRRGFKGDFSWNIGDHKITIGAEHYKHYINNTITTTEGGQWTYYDRPNTVLPNGSPAPADGKYVAQFYEMTGGAFTTVNKAFYMDDYWQVADRWVAYMGARFDTFINKNVNGQNFLRMPITSPRLGVSWDVHGDSTTKLGVNLGKYALAMPSSVNNGAAGAVYEWNRYYTYTGMDPTTKAPTGLTQIGPQSTLINGQAPTYYNVATSNIKAPYQYELQVYLQQSFGTAWSGQAELGFSSLKRIIDDTCYNQGITDYANAHGYPNYVDESGCPVFNPGIAQVFTRDFNGDGKLEQLTIPGNVFGPPPKRKYAHLTLEVNHQRTSDEPYFLDVSYTWAHLYGNDDGLLNLGTRTGGGPGEQIYWDFPGLMEHGDGDLAGDIRHALNINGIYYFHSGVRVGTTLDMHTGEPLSCLGTYPDINNPAQLYGAASHYCNGVPAPLGTAGRLPFFWQWNLGVGYDWVINADNRLSVDLQVQNVTNRMGRIDSNQIYDNGSLPSNGVWSLNPSYGAATWQAPRTTQLVLRYTFQ